MGVRTGSGITHTTLQPMGSQLPTGAPMLLPTLRRCGITRTNGTDSSSTGTSSRARHAATPLLMGREGITPGLPTTAPALLPMLRRCGITHTNGMNSSNTEPSICARHAATPLRMGREGITPGLPPNSGDARLARA
jgi:hypothetical protein